ncbi:ATP-binding protein [Streptomyces glomeratus]|uniref:histidine kinase n=1 Tax=Streptomyces glomeratus TaxID=284452 RepID=A0ABP6KZH1_9ACTN|nr:ATP-binding protein [Streptomyces glomeratus]MCF1512084.1 ATP-binding protein [Streptomyces glomeratus]
MSHLRAPAARADLREGGRHGRPVAHTTPSPAETPLRPQLLRLAILPPVAVALSACAAVLFTVRTAGARPTITLWAVLAGALAVALAGIVIAAVAAERTATSVRDRLDALRRASARGEADLRALVEALRRGEAPPAHRPHGKPTEDADDFELLAAELARAHDGAVAAVVQAAQLSSQAGSEQKLEVFVNLARRLQSLVHREISILDELENELEDPDLLKGLFHVDHLATRIRRHAENLAVLGGAVSRRQWSTPVPMTEVLRSATAEVEQYARVRLVPPTEGTLRGHAVADVIHLLAELVENATVFSAPHTQVLLRAGLVTSGLAVEVEDRGLGMPPAELHRMNALLADPDQVNVAGLLADGRIGLFVVSQLARRHGIHVRLQTNIYGGVQAVLVVPQSLLGGTTSTTEAMTPPIPQARDTGRTPVVPQTTHTGRTPLAPPGGASAREPDPADAHAPAPPPWESQAAGASPGASEHPVPTGPRQSWEHGAPADRARSPLPVRYADAPRPNPAEALPGCRPGDRPVPVEAAGGPVTAPGRQVAAPGGHPTSPTGAVRGTMGKPRLPRRRAQEHIAPQLRGAPTPPVRQDAGPLAGHDPGLMAAFQRGILLAQARQQSEPDGTETTARAEPAAAPRPPDHDPTGRHHRNTPAG